MSGLKRRNGLGRRRAEATFEIGGAKVSAPDQRLGLSIPGASGAVIVTCDRSDPRPDQATESQARVRTTVARLNLCPALLDPSCAVSAFADEESSNATNL